jgi:hypothetical protein
VAVFGLLLAVSPEGAQGACTLATTTLTSNVAQTNANSPTATLTLKTNRALCSGQTMTVKDNAGLTVFTGSGPTAGAASYSISVTPPNKAARTYTSNLGGSVTVTNVGWNGTLTLTPSSSTTTANAQVATLTLTMSKQIVSPYFVCLYDEAGARVLYASNAAQSGTVFTLTYSAQPLNLASKSYRAYVATTCPTSGVPGAAQGLAVASASVSVTNLGWDGTLSLAASPTSTDVNAPSSTLTATMSKQIVSPYFVCIYDEVNNQVLISSSAASTGTAFSVTKSVTVANLATKTYTAVVATSCPPTGPATGIAKTSAALPVMNLGWVGTLTLSADKSTTDVNAPTAVLTASVSKPIVSPYFLCVYDDLGARVMYTSGPGTWDGTQYIVNQTVQPQDKATRTYTAYIALSCPTPGPLGAGNGIAKTSAPYSITNQGWTGTVSLTADTTTTDVNNPNATLTMTTTKQVVGPYYACLYDDEEGRYFQYSNLYPSAAGNGTFEVTWPVTTQPNTAVNYIAIVATACPSPGPYDDATVSGIGELIVSNIGWRGAIKIEAPQGALPATFTATLTTTKAVVGPYIASLYDTAGSQVWSAASSQTNTSWSVPLSPSQTGSSTYTAFVARDAPASGEPGVDVRARYSITLTAGQDPLTSLDGVSDAAIAAALAGLTAEDIALMLGQWPACKEAYKSTACPLGAEFYQAQAGAATYATVFRVLFISAAAAGLSIYQGVERVNRQKTNVQPIPPSTPAPAPPSGGVQPGVPLTPGPSPLDNLAQELIIRPNNFADAAGHNQTQIRVLARTLAQKCMERVDAGLQNGLQQRSDGRHWCSIAIHAPGSLAPLTTAFDADKIATVYPPWVLQQYVPGRRLRTKVLDRLWFDRAPIETNCKNRPAGTSCHEFPYFATAGSGTQAKLKTGGGTLLHDAAVGGVATDDNRKGGGLYSGFLYACGLVQRAKTQTSSVSGEELLWVPLTFAGAPGQLWVCG